MDVLEDVVLVAVVMGGESTHPKHPIKKICVIHLHLDLRCSFVEVGGRSRQRLQGFFGAFAGIFLRLFTDYAPPARAG